MICLIDLFFKRYSHSFLPSIGQLEISTAGKLSTRPRKCFSLQHAEENISVATPVQSISFKPNESSKPVTGKQEISSFSSFDIICFCSLRQHLILQAAFCLCVWYLLSCLTRICKDVYHLLSNSKNTERGECVSFLVRILPGSNLGNNKRCCCPNESFDLEDENYMDTIDSEHLAHHPLVT